MIPIKDVTYICIKDTTYSKVGDTITSPTQHLSPDYWQPIWGPYPDQVQSRRVVGWTRTGCVVETEEGGIELITGKQLNEILGTD